jgi:5'(3')-deoxyribonucleotidase
VRLGIDLDGVVANFNEGWMQRYNKERGTNLTPDLVDHWDAMVQLTEFESGRDFWQWARNGQGPGLFRHLPVYPDAVPALERLSHNHEIVIITTKPRWSISDTYAWIADNRIPTKEVHITGRKWTVDCDIYLDDGPHNVESLALERPDRTVCRFVRPWNEPVAGAIDVDSWDTFETLVNKRFC